jgi:hypothetical protein
MPQGVARPTSGARDRAPLDGTIVPSNRPPAFAGFICHMVPRETLAAIEPEPTPVALSEDAAKG